VVKKRKTNQANVLTKKKCPIRGGEGEPLFVGGGENVKMGKRPGKAMLGENEIRQRTGGIPGN